MEQPWLQRIDHLTFVVRPHTIRKWAWLYIEVFGGKLVLRVDDTNPGQSSSMMLWCIDFGSFGIALVAGLDGAEKSHVSAFADRHGDHSIQHVAFQVPNLEHFQQAMIEKVGLQILGPPHERHDGFGYVRQVFAKGYTGELNPAETGFPEFVERPERRHEPFPEVSFSARVGMSLYKQAQTAMMNDDRSEVFDFSKMPAEWDPGWVNPPGAEPPRSSSSSGEWTSSKSGPSSIPRPR